MANDDSKNLDLLSTFHYVVAGITALFSCMPFIHVFIGIATLTGKVITCDKNAGPPEALFGWLFIIMGSVFILLGWSLAVCMFIAGKKLKSRKSRMFCVVIAAIECMFMPFGTVLGVFTLILLNKDSVKELFAQSETTN
ncbi:MAG: hypothetical protein CXR31_14110 [Geobacter sp.]|nr:MAG: hypothetical protein CXR31_14110 [Geobacter sp.]